MNANILERISETGKKAEKQALLKELDEPTKRLIHMSLDQNITYGVTIWDDEGCELEWRRANRGALAGRAMVETAWTSWMLRSLDKFKDRELTGNAATDLVKEIVQRAPSQLHAKWAGRIINRNLRAGFDRSTFNKAFGKNAVKKFEVQLADTYGDQILEGEWIFEPKLNGNRVVGFKGVPTSRGNKTYPAAEPIFDQLRKIKNFFAEFVPDGEMMGDLGFDQSSGALRRQVVDKKGRKKANFTYWLFDLFTLTEYETQDTEVLRTRKERLKQFFKENGALLPNVKMVPWTIVMDPTHSQIMKITQDFVNAGFEGSMAKRLDSKATFKRSSDLLKCKLFYEDDFKVVDFYEGKNNIKGTLGGFWVEGTIKWGHPGKPRLTYNVRSKVGSGFKIKFNPKEPDGVLRDNVWNNKSDWLGAVVQIQFQEATKDGSLQFPVFIMRRKDKE